MNVVWMHLLADVEWKVNEVMNILCPGNAHSGEDKQYNVKIGVFFPVESVAFIVIVRKNGSIR